MTALGPTPGGSFTLLDISAATVVANGASVLYRVSVTTAGAAGAVYDNNSTSGNTAANQIAVIPAVVDVYEFEWPCSVGITYAPGSGQVASISYAGGP